ncbi:MAG TPA: Ig-like domain-containing protein [Bacteroidales bacterium]|nr:Ig-like domain-containing protein [Bacteroidales bacterium]
MGKGAVITAVFLFFSCANVVAPTGGPVDETPPQVVRSNPPLNSPNFEGYEVRVEFDEFVQLTNINQKLLVSPPLSKMPQARIRGRSVILSWQDTLRDNTTYNFFFGNAIVDITEGNAIPNFQIVFSTGPFVDSLSLAGVVTDAFTREPEDEVYVMLYKPGNDSIPYQETPVYLAKTDKEGRFRIGNIGTGAYMVFALDDLNANFLFDLPNERIAFLDTLVVPVWEEPAIPATDTMPGNQDQQLQPEDINRRTARIGTTPARSENNFSAVQERLQTEEIPAQTSPALTALNLEMNMFVEPDTAQRLVSTSVPRMGFMSLNFRVPFDSIVFRDLSETLSDQWFVSEPYAGGDTLHLWILPPVPDSLFLEVSDRSMILDTIRVATKPRTVRERIATPDETPKLPVRLNTTVTAALAYFHLLEIIADNPIQSFDSAYFSLMDADSVMIQPDFAFVAPVNRKLTLQTPLQQDKRYHLLMLPGALTDIYGLTNDTVRATFSTTKNEDYGTLILNLHVENQQSQLILHLIDNRGNTLREMVVPPGGVCIIPHLSPATYRIRLIHDLNNNGKWDPGHFMERRQPEPVFMKPQEIQIRQNWESEVNWRINLR